MRELAGLLPSDTLTTSKYPRLPQVIPFIYILQVREIGNIAQLGWALAWQNYASKLKTLNQIFE